MNAGGDFGFTHMPDRADDERKRNRRRVSQLTAKHENAAILVPMDALKDDDIRSVFDHTAKKFGKIDFLLHSIAFADRNDLNRETIDTSRAGFALAMDVSVYTLLACSAAAKPIMNAGGAIAAMTYFGGEKCVPGYNVMLICKAALEAAVRYAAYALGPQEIRVTALSAGPVRTLAGRAAGVEDMLKLYDQMAPLGRNITHEEVGRTGAFLLSDASNGITGEILHVDGGYNAMGSPGRLLNQLKPS